MTFSQNFDSEQEVDVAFAHAMAFDAKSLKQPQKVFWGGYWKQSLVLMQVMRPLAKVLWEANKTHALRWNVSLEIVGEAVRGEPTASDSKIRANVSRLADWLTERGVSIQISVKARAQPACIECEIFSVNEDTIGSQQELGIEHRTAAIRNAVAKPNRKTVRRDSVDDLAKKIKQS